MGIAFTIAFFFILASAILGITVGTKKNQKLSVSSSVAEEKLKSMNFNIEKSVGITAKLYIDNTQKLWAIKEWKEGTDMKIHNFSDLIDFELIEDDQSVIKGSMGKAMVGGALGGTMGAVIGSAGSKQIKQNCSLLEIRVRVNDFQHPQYNITLLNGVPFSKTSDVYKRFYEEAQEIIGALNYIATNGTEAKEESAPLQSESLGSKLRELNELKNEGIISEEEFETKKKELLNM